MEGSAARRPWWGRAGVLAKETVTRWLDADAPTHGAALAFYTVFSLAPVLLIAVAVAAALVGEESARAEIDRQIRRLLGGDSARLAHDVMLQAATTNGSKGAGAV